MADTSVQARVSESDRLYSAWRWTRAKWELEIHAPGNDGADLPEEAEDRLSDADHAALLAYLLHPAGSLFELARKLRVFEDEGAECFAELPRLISVIRRDAQQLAARPARKTKTGPGQTASADAWLAAWEGYAAAKRMASEAASRAGELPARRLQRQCPEDSRKVVAARARLVATPAPNLSAVLAKITAIRECAASGWVEPAEFEHLAADVERLETHAS